jgi:hypothetical protein
MVELRELGEAVVTAMRDMLAPFSDDEYERRWGWSPAAAVRTRIDQLDAVLDGRPGPTLPEVLARQGVNGFGGWRCGTAVEG